MDFIRLDMDCKVPQSPFVLYSVMCFQTGNLGKRDFRYLTLIGIERGDTFRAGSISAYVLKRVHERGRFRLSGCAKDSIRIDANTARELYPQFRMIWGTRFFINQILEQ